MPTLLKKIVVSLMLSLVLLLSTSSFFVASGQTSNKSAAAPSTSTTSPWYNQGIGDWYLKVYDAKNPSEIFGERYTAAQVQWVFYGVFANIINMAIGPKGGAIVACVLSGVASGVTGGQSSLSSSCLGTALSGLLSDNSLDKSAAPENKNLLSLVFATNRPFSGIAYIKDKIQNFSLVPVAHAQSVGVGFTALTLVQNMWKAFRDVAFGLFVIAAIALAFMVMFRVKISPQVVISAQSAIPKVIIALVLVTFSYAIAGLLIDLMFVVIGFISLTMAPIFPNSTTIVIPTIPHTAPDLFNLLTIGPVTAKTVTAPASAGGIIGFMGLYLGPLMLLLVILLLLSVVATALSGGAFGPVALIMFLLIVIVIVVLLWMGIKTIWALLKAFANILLLTIFAPLQLVAGTVIPNFGFGQWIRSFLSHLSVFIVTGVLALFALMFEVMAWNQAFTGTSLLATSQGVTANPWPPLLGSGSGANLLFLGVSFVMFTLIPKSTEIIQGFISGKPFAYGSAIGEAIGPVVTLGQGALAAGNTKREQKREEAARLAGATYIPDPFTQFMQTTGIIRGR